MRNLVLRFDGGNSARAAVDPRVGQAIWQHSCQSLVVLLLSPVDEQQARNMASEWGGELIGTHQGPWSLATAM